MRIMPYIKRNNTGEIIAVFQSSSDEVNEFLPSEHPEILKFFRDNDVPLESIKWELNESDISLIRVIEDLIDILIDKDVIKITDFPTSVIDKLNLRKRFREQLHWYDELFIDFEKDKDQVEDN